MVEEGTGGVKERKEKGVKGKKGVKKRKGREQERKKEPG